MYACVFIMHKRIGSHGNVSMSMFANVSICVYT